MQKEQIIPVTNTSPVNALPPLNSTNTKVASSPAMVTWTEENVKKWLIEKDLKELQKRYVPGPDKFHAQLRKAPLFKYSKVASPYY